MRRGPPRIEQAPMRQEPLDPLRFSSETLERAGRRPALAFSDSSFSCKLPKRSANSSQPGTDGNLSCGAGVAKWTGMPVASPCRRKETVGRRCHSAWVDDLHRLSVEGLVARYKNAASRHGQATQGADPSIGNAEAETLASAYRELRRRGSRPALLVLLESPDLGVRSWAATHAMDFAPSEGEPVLTALAESKESGLIGLSAEMTLTEWRKGRLRFP
jgi:hypothetical protein